MSELKTAEASVQTPEQHFFQVVNKHIGVPKEKEYVDNWAGGYNPEAVSVPEVTKDGALEIVRAYKAKLEADALTYKAKKQPHLAEDLEKHIWDCDMAVDTLEGKSKNADPLVRTMSDVVTAQLRQNQEDYIHRRPHVEEYIKTLVLSGADRIWDVNNYRSKVQRIRDHKDSLAEGLLTTVVTKANEWSGASVPK